MNRWHATKTAQHTLPGSAARTLTAGSQQTSKPAPREAPPSA